MPFAPEHLEKMREGVRLFNMQHYWECHEALEEVWLEDRQDPVRNVYWAVIQVAAAMVHFREKNLVGATGMLNKAREKFRRCRDLHVLTPLALTELDWERLESLVAGVPEQPSDLTPFTQLYDFRFTRFPLEGA